MLFRSDLLGDVIVDLMHELLDHLMRWSRVKDVLLDRNILVVELLQKAKWRESLAVRLKTVLAEFLSDGLKNLDILSLDSPKLGVALAGENGIHVAIRKLAGALDDGLANPDIFVGNGPSHGIDLERNTDSESLLTWNERADVIDNLRWEQIGRASCRERVF